MRSSNPVFSRRGFSRDNGYAGFNAAPQAGGPLSARRATRTRSRRGNPYAPEPLRAARTSSTARRRRPRPPPAG